MRTVAKRMLVGSVLLAALAGAFAVRRHRAPEVASTPPGQAATGLRPKLTPGTQLTYALTWKAHTRGVVVPGQAGQGEIEIGTTIESDLVVRCIGLRDGLAYLAVGLEGIRAIDVHLGAKDAVSDAAAAKRTLEGQRALVSLDARGIVQAISFRKDAPAAVRNALQAIVEQLQVTFPEQAGDAWDAVEVTPNGIARVQYALGEDGHTLTRTRGSYSMLASFPSEKLDGQQALAAKDVIVLDDDGRIVSITGSEDLRYTRPKGTSPAYASTSSFVLTRTSTSAFDASALSMGDVEAQPLGVLAKAAPEGPSQLQHLAKDMSEAVIDDVIASVSKGGSLPKNFVARAGAFLRLHPEACDGLVDAFETASTTTRGRALVLDVLAFAGHAAAQAAMRDALSSPSAATAGPQLGMLFQRFAFVSHPEKASLDFAANAFAHGDASVRGAAAVALGAMLRKLEGTEEAALAKTYNAQLVEGLGKATAPEDKRAMLMALGNSRLEGNGDVIRRYSADADGTVRTQVARSLSGFDTRESRGTLIDLATDGDSTVARASFASMHDVKLDASDWTRLEALATTAKTNGDADAALVNLLEAKRADAGEHGDAILRAILARTASTNGDLLALVRRMLANGEEQL